MKIKKSLILCIVHFYIIKPINFKTEKYFFPLPFRIQRGEISEDTATCKFIIYFPGSLKASGFPNEGQTLVAKLGVSRRKGMKHSDHVP